MFNTKKKNQTQDIPRKFLTIPFISKLSFIILALSYPNMCFVFRNLMFCAGKLI